MLGYFTGVPIAVECHNSCRGIINPSLTTTEKVQQCSVPAGVQTFQMLQKSHSTALHRLFHPLYLSPGKCHSAQAALAAEEDEAQPSGRDFDDTASEASSAVSGMSAYGGSTTTGPSSVAGSTARSASTVGGKKPYKRKKKV